MKHALSQSAITAEFLATVTALCASIETLSGDRREEAEDRLLAAKHWLEAHHAGDFARCETSYPRSRSNVARHAYIAPLHRAKRELVAA
jgi:hypothetical protein